MSEIKQLQLFSAIAITASVIAFLWLIPQIAYTKVPIFEFGGVLIFAIFSLLWGSLIFGVWIEMKYGKKSN